MITVEDRLRRLSDAVTPADLPTAAAVMRRGRQRRHRRRGAGAVTAAVLVSGGGLAVRMLGEQESATLLTTAPEVTDGTGSGTTTGPGDPTELTVPDVRGLTVGGARPVLEGLGLAVQAARPETTDANVVVAQEPAAGTTARLGDRVTLQVADLERPAYVEGPLIRGRLSDGRAWTLGSSSQFGLCLSIGPADFGCNIPAFRTPDDDPALPVIAEDDPAYPHPPNQPGRSLLVYGVLPDAAEAVELVYGDGRTSRGGIVVEPTQRFWAMPVEPAGEGPVAVLYLSAAGTEVARYDIGR